MMGGKNELKVNPVLFSYSENLVRLNGIHHCGFFRSLINNPVTDED